MEVKDNASRGLADNQWHSVEVHHRHHGDDDDGIVDVVDDVGDGDDDDDDGDQALFLKVLREGGSLSLVVDSSLASLNSLGSKPLRLDGILFLGEHPHGGD